MNSQRIFLVHHCGPRLFWNIKMTAMASCENAQNFNFRLDKLGENFK